MWIACPRSSRSPVSPRRYAAACAASRDLDLPTVWSTPTGNVWPAESSAAVRRTPIGHPRSQGHRRRMTRSAVLGGALGRPTEEQPPLAELVAEPEAVGRD